MRTQCYGTCIVDALFYSEPCCNKLGILWNICEERNSSFRGDYSLRRASMKFFRNNPLEKFFFVINNTIIINNIRDKKIDKSNYCTNLLRVWYRVKIKIKRRIFDKHFKLENYSQQYWFQNLDSITKLLDQASNLNITSNCQKITQQRSKIPKKFLNCSIDAQKKTHRTSFNDLIINSSANHAICHNWKISLFNALVRAKYPPQISQKRGGAEGRRERWKREKKRVWKGVRDVGEKEKQVVVIVGRWQCGCTFASGHVSQRTCI